MKMPKGFIPMGRNKTKGDWLNIDIVAETIDKGNGISVVVCKNGETYNLPTDCVKGRI